MPKPFQAVTPVYDEQGELVGVRFRPSLKGKELEAAKAQFFAMMSAALNEKEQS